MLPTPTVLTLSCYQLKPDTYRADFIVAVDRRRADPTTLPLGKFCGALFRIRNVGTSTVCVAPGHVRDVLQWLGSDRASVSVDGAKHLGQLVRQPSETRAGPVL